MHDLLNTDLYEVLGIAPDAGADEISRAYRKLARAHHPDLNPDDPEAEERFKRLAAAHEILADPDKRAEYDQFRSMVGRGFTGDGFGADRGRGAGWGRAGGTRRTDPGGFDTAGFDTAGFDTAGFDAAGFDAAGFDLGDILGGLFGGASFAGQAGGPGRPFPMRGPDVTGTVQVRLADVLHGTTVGVRLPDGTAVDVAIPAGVDDGQVVRLRGRGLPGVDGGPAGDLVVEVRVEPDVRFVRDGADLTVDVPVGFGTAVLGGSARVPTLDGGHVTVRVPAGAADGRRLRIGGRGLPGPSGRGDLFARLRVHVPTHLDDDLREVLDGVRDRLEP